MPVRTARKGDAAAVTRLLQSAPATHFHVDWHLPVDWLGDGGFVVIPKENGRSRNGDMSSFVLGRDEAAACLAVTPDPPPAAWVRLTAVSDELDTFAALAGMFALATAHLRETAVSEVGWLVMDEWPLAHLPALGFHQTNEIQTYVKEDLSLPPIQEVAGLEIRPARVDDLAELAALETAVFAPLWRFSETTLLLASRTAVSFDTAVLDGKLVGYQISTLGRYGAHLVRMTISPELQGRGVGSALMARTITGYREHGGRYATLNTQADNTASHRLYKKFGFVPNGEVIPLWVLPITGERTKVRTTNQYEEV